MYIEHIAMYVNDLEKTKEFFIKYLGAKANNIYHNKKTDFKSYFLTFDSEKNIFAEMNIKTSDYILLKKYFKKYKVLVKDEFKKI